MQSNALTQQDDGQSTTKREIGRAIRAAAVHSAAEWMSSSDAPMPGLVEIRTHVHGPDVMARLAQVHEFADAHGITVEQHNTSVWARLQLAWSADTGVDVFVIVQTHTDKPGEVWDRA